MLTIKIQDIDRTNLIDWSLFELTKVLTKEVDTLNFSIKVHAGQTYFPEVGQEITIWEGATKIYGGVIVEAERKIGGRLKRYDIICKDYHYWLDRVLVYKSYENQNAGDIVKDIINVFTVGFTTTNVQTGSKIEKIQFNYEQVSRAIQQIAERINWDWYVDENKDLHFFSKEFATAPFELNDTGGNFIWNSLQFNTNINQVKNSIFVRGGTEALGPKTFTKIADGGQRIFNLGYEFTDLTIKKGGVVQTLGKDGITDPDTVDVLYNPNNQTAIFREDNKPANGVEFWWSGNASMPVIVHVEDSASITLYGEFQFRILDKSISSNAEAKQRALAELEKYKTDTSEVVFRTKKEGLVVGQKIRLNSAYWGIDKWFLINRIITKVVDPLVNEKEHIVSLIASEQVGIIDVLSKFLISDPNKNITIYQDEILSKYKSVSEVCKILETITKKAHELISEIGSILENIRKDPWGVGIAPTWVLGPYAPPTGDSDPKRPIFLDRGGWVY